MLIYYVEILQFNKYILSCSFFLEEENKGGSVRLSFRDEGRGHVLVFIHSYLLDKDAWRGQIELLKKDFRCISIDLPAHGESDSIELERDVSLKFIAEEIVMLLKKLKISKYVCIGASLGGMIVPDICILDKERLSAVIMINTYLGDETKEVKQLFLSFLDIAALYNKVPEGLIEQVKPLFFHNTTKKNRKYCNLFSDKLRSLGGDRLETLVKIGKSVLENEENLLEKVKTSNIPVCLINGENNVFYPFERNYKVCKDIKNIEIFKLEDTEYMFNEKDNINIYNIIKSFLREREYY